ncbi:protein Aster-B isoform X1 [Tribolium castaneum]|uniref:GRAM domain-containing protein 1B-like Protein n=1 Tax=Tribolium castaneum TaxID=7070 RepID=D6WAV3_TRICA|nr:PREDICTED: GRAM domain-containing protein 1B isoform X1 [Tribolium castaneum]XP_969102.1 PREDICTED: GRAM domain-containing protein 1B isoform X1 [Tribolium castaneum]EEZ97945.2 GRAM domain-containing protein 1B-like Protein [Tribolium castaneum]|eukprot:XP_008201680.1 PREDICTED: GRAM domain-containing protein 1B isoform X1 [Tribolium castaneum]
MKMTLSSTNGTTNEKLTTPTENKQGSPNSSPRASPRPSPRPQPKREHPKSETHLTVNYKEIPGSNKHDGSPSSQESSVSSRASNLDISPPSNLKVESTSSSNKERKDPRGKKKSSWFNPFYPTYKSRSEDFKRIFKDVPDDERLLVDYSCALQKEILAQGRLYVTQNYLCFYANILGWETTLKLKWKDVSAITKEKTAIVIPNAVLICTRTEKYFFTSFVARDKTYLMLFRVWQNALMDQPMSPQEMWQWVHQWYGEELGLTSDDEDYVAPGTEEDKLSARLSVESFSEHESSAVENPLEAMVVEEKPPQDDDSVTNRPVDRRRTTSSHLPTDYSDTTESDGEKQTKTKPTFFLSWDKSSPFLHPSSPEYDDTVPVLPNVKCDTHVQCTSTHEGRQIMNEIVPIHIDQLFTLLFTSSKFYLDFHASRKTTDLTQTPWTHNPSDNSKTRVVNLTVALTQAMGPKTAQVTETQVMLPCSKAGCLYAIDVDTVNAGIPYADSFNIVVHHCLQKISETESSYQVFAQVMYKKSVWGLVKGMIEKTCWSGLEDFYVSLAKALHVEGEENVCDVKRKSRRKRRIHSMPRPGVEDSRPLIGASSRISSGGIFSSDVATMIVFTVLILLVVLNVMLYFKLWSLEESPPYTLLDLHVLKDPPKTHDEWIKLLQQQETLHSVELQKWQRVLKTAIQLLKQTEESLNELQRSINPSYSSKVMSILQNHKDTVEQNEKSEL